MDKKTKKVTIASSKPVEEGILTVVNHLLAKEQANGKNAKAIANDYTFANSFSVATLIKHYFDEVSYAIFSVASTESKEVIEHACVVLEKKADTFYFDINGKKTLDEMKKFVAKRAKASYKNVEVKEGFFYAITSVTNAVFNEIERAKSAKKAAIKAPTKPVSKPASKPAKAVATKKTTVVAKKPVAKTTTKAASKNTNKKPVAKASAKTTKTAVKPATKTSAKPVAKKTTAKPATKATANKKSATKTTAKKSK